MTTRTRAAIRRDFVQQQRTAHLTALQGSDVPSIQRRKICDLMDGGKSEQEIAAATGWSIIDIWRAIAERTAA